MRTLLLLALLTTAGLAGCTDTDPASTQPAAATHSYDSVAPTDPTGLEYVARLRDANGEGLPTAGGIWEYGDYVFGSGRNTPWWIADISDPEKPVLLWRDVEMQTPYSRDMDIIEHPDGRLTVAIATQDDGLHFWDVTDPSAPVFLSVGDAFLNHNLAVMPGTTYVFNSVHRGEGYSNEIFDLSDPSFPVLLGRYGDHGCHHTFFWESPSDDTMLVACAAVTQTEIWDVTGFDPAAPDMGIETLGIVEGGTLDSPVLGNHVLFNRAPLYSFHHSAFINEDGTVLIIGDEHNGAGSPGVCFVNEENTGTSTPFGALWFYDIQDKSDPQLLSWFSPDAPERDYQLPFEDADEGQDWLNGHGPGCTSHFGDLIPGHDRFVFAWYSVGVILLDFSDPASPTVLDTYQAHYNGYRPYQDTWDAREQGGYIFTGDGARGMDVLRLV